MKNTLFKKGSFLYEVVVSKLWILLWTLFCVGVYFIHVRQFTHQPGEGEITPEDLSLEPVLVLVMHSYDNRHHDLLQHVSEPEIQEEIISLCLTIKHAYPLEVAQLEIRSFGCIPLPYLDIISGDVRYSIVLGYAADPPIYQQPIYITDESAYVAISKEVRNTATAQLNTPWSDVWVSKMSRQDYDTLYELVWSYKGNELERSEARLGRWINGASFLDDPTLPFYKPG